MKKQSKISSLLESTIRNIVLNELSPKTRASAFSKAQKDWESSDSDSAKRVKRAQQAGKFLEIPKQYHQRAKSIVDKISSEYTLGEGGELSYMLRKEVSGLVSFKIELKYMPDYKKPNQFVWITMFTANITPDGKVNTKYNTKELPNDMKDISNTPINRMLGKLVNDLKDEAVATGIGESSVSLQEIKRMQELSGIKPIN